MFSLSRSKSPQEADLVLRSFKHRVVLLYSWQQLVHVKHVADRCCRCKAQVFWKDQFQILTQKWLLGNIKYFVSFKLKSLNSNGLRWNITLSEYLPQPVSFLDVKIDF